jgi:putative restriction endonuclease
MKGYIANTDFDWYGFLKTREDLEEVNFWQPSGGRGFQAISPGAPFFFRLKKPHYAIAGFGFYHSSFRLPMWLAWDSFGVANGAPNFDLMCRQIERNLRSGRIDPQGQHEIGCLIIFQPVFFDRSDWIREPNDWHRNIVQGASYDLLSGEGKRIFEECVHVARLRKPSLIAEPVDRYGNPVLVRPRLGQGTFRVAVLDAYGRACSVTGEHSLPVLEAAHIRPYSRGGLHEVTNGLLLRSDIHRLFDQGYVTVTTDHRFEVSRRLKADFENGRSYYPLNGQHVRLPESKSAHPDRNLLIWHNESLFLG